MVFLLTVYPEANEKSTDCSDNVATIRPYTQAVEMMCRDTLTYDEHQFIWSEEKI